MGGHQDALEIHGAFNTAAERIAVCVGKGQRGIQALKWALEKVVPPQGHVYLLHVKPPLRWIPNPLGGKLPVNQVNPEVVRRFAEDCLLDAQKIVSSYTKLCNRSKVTCEPVYAENDSIQKEIVYQISKLGIKKLILEISSQNAITRALKKESISAYVAKHAPDFCSVCVICKGKLCSVRDASSSDSDSSIWNAASETSSSSGKAIEDDDSSTAGLQSAEEGMHSVYLSNASRPRLPQSASMDISRVPLESPMLYGNDSDLVQSAVTKVMVKNRSSMPPSRLSEFGSVTQRVINWQRFDNDTACSIAELDRQTVAGSSDQDSPTDVYTDKPGCIATSLNESLNGIVNASQLVETNSSDCDAVSEPSLETEISARSSMLEALSSQNSLTEMEIVQVDIHRESCNESLEFNLLQHQLSEAKQLAQREAERQANNFKQAEDILENARIKISEWERHRDIAVNELRIAAQKASHYQNDVQRTKALLQAALQKQETLQERLAAEEQKNSVLQNELETARKMAETFAMRASLKEQELQEERRRCRELSSKLGEVVKQFEECRLQMEAEDDRLKQEQLFFSEYSFKELELATDNFHEENKLGQGGYGPVYKGKLHHTTVAIKLLAREGSRGRGEFQKEVELLSGLRHPHLVTLLGSCSERGCLVYQYMANGSLEDRINCRDGTPPLPWRTRIRICLEIATALLFLHSQPQPVVHRDLKPGNILLDDQFSSKISDVGLAKLVPDDVTFSVTMYKETMLVGTFAYMDPDYQRTGIISCESDVYSLGIIMLQLLMARPAIGLAHLVEEAVDKGQLVDILDKSAGQWPLDEAMALARLSLQCTEPRRKNRPSLKSELLPELERIHGRSSAQITGTKKLSSASTKHGNESELKSLGYLH